LLTKGKIEPLGGNYTVFLAKFELGNIVWKEVFLHKRITREEGLRLLFFISKVMNTMNLEDVNCIEAEEIAIDFGITFYDASYVWLARKLDLPLVSEDNRLREALGKKLEVLSVDEIK
jgi:predicted nucleic acid-binding protein